MLKKLLKVLKNPKKVLIFLSSKGIIKYNDEKYLKFVYKERMGEELNLDDPIKFTEKLQWLKLYNRNADYTKLVDKYEVQDYIKKTIGEKYLIPNYGVYDSFDEIDFGKLPNKFVLKTTHDSGTVLICKDKKNFDYKYAKKYLTKRLKRKYYFLWREWPYKNVKPRIIVEAFMEDKYTKELNDYKFYCFDGKAKMMFIVVDRGNNTKLNFYDMEFNRLDLQQVYPNFTKKIKKPKQFDEMVDLAEKLSKNIPHVRVDFYIINDQIYFGEMTFFDAAGLDKFTPDKYDEILGSYIDLKKIKTDVKK
ncbi:MAG: glycosyl transferase [Firmicutes bacterium]|nr:glycosyl transferase [Bacillota bacterium]